MIIRPYALPPPHAPSPTPQVPSPPLLLLQVLIVPRQITSGAVPLVTRDRQTVELARVDDELRVDTQGLQRLVHLLAADDGHVEVLFSTQVERRRLDRIGLEE